jgi:hypothetical protein
MIDHRIISAVAICFLVVAISNAQGKKIIKEKGIATITVNEYFIGEGMDEPVVESIEKFNEDGERVEIREFNKKGETKRWEKYLYDKDGNVVEQIFLDGKGRITETEKNVYDGKLRIEKQYYNKKGKLYKKKVYQYEYR